MSTLLEVAGLNVSFATREGPVQAVRELSFSLGSGEVLGIVGESGSGKTQAALALTGLLAGNGRMSGSVLFDGRQLAGLPEPASTIRAPPSSMAWCCFAASASST